MPKIFPHAGQATDDQPPADSFERQLIQREAEIGGQLFGPVPKGRVRRFFCLDMHTWVWHEEWTENGKQRAVTTRYEVRPGGVLKIQDGGGYQRLSREEAANLYRATELYQQRVGREYQRMLQTA
ncbi:MAG TPA: hypothetical protein VHC21_01890 [Candidatus Saccharimonadales bacterium]|nr:hypothetical protein [Candidatus Saccharimonadales bacterium]